jgi:hypothetical protein
VLTEEEDKIYENRFNYDLQSRLIQTTSGLEPQKAIGYFSTGAASAIRAAAFGNTIKQ